MKDQFCYTQFTSRNAMYIDSQTQKQLKNLKIIFFGTGLNSIICEHLVRLGLINLSLYDGDKIELSNLNRQAFSQQDIGSDKVEVLKDKLLKINPLCNIKVNQKFIKEMSEVSEEIENSDIIINTVDCTQIYFDIVEYARAQNKLVICPFNPGFGGLVLLFTKESASIYDIFNVNVNITLDDIEISRQLFTKYPFIKTVDQAGHTIDGFIKKVLTQRFFPQMIIGALQSSAFILTSVIKYIRKEKLTTAPAIFYLDCYNL